jgi:phosphopantetheinyl transferase
MKPLAIIEDPHFTLHVFVSPSREHAQQHHLDLIAAHLGVKLNDIQLGYDVHGALHLISPAIPSFFLSRSYRKFKKGEWLSALAFSQKRIGVDVEGVQGSTSLPLALLHPDEQTWILQKPLDEQAQAFTQLWTLKEAYLKAKGLGLKQPLDSFALRIQQALMRGDGVTAYQIQCDENAKDKSLSPSFFSKRYESDGMYFWVGIVMVEK